MCRPNGERAAEHTVQVACFVTTGEQHFPIAKLAQLGRLQQEALQGWTAVGKPFVALQRKMQVGRGCHGRSVRRGWSQSSRF
jgi:hypothetical protein